MASLTQGMSLGTGSSSALIRSAGSIAKARADYEDKVMALQWSNSAKTDEDWAMYKGYLDTRINKLSTTGTMADASKALTLVSTQSSSQKSWVTSSIQRQSISILEGNGNLQDKANAIASFYEMANANGDTGLAQTLRYQFDQVDQQIQYQAEQSQNLADKMRKANVTSLGAYVDTMKASLKQFSTQFNEFGAKGLDVLSKQYKDSLINMGVDVKGGNDPSIWDIVSGVTDNILSTLQTGMNMYGPIDGASLFTQYNSIVSGETSFKVGGITVNYNDIKDAQAAANAGQQWAVPVVKGGKTVLSKNKEQSYMWGKDPDSGQYRLVTGYSSQGADLGNSGSYRIKDGKYLKANGEVVAQEKNGKIVDKSGKEFLDKASLNSKLAEAEYSYQDLLKSAGFDVFERDGGLYIAGTNQSAGGKFKVPGLEDGQQVQVLRGNNGQLRFIAPPDEEGNMKMYGLSFDNSKGGALSSFFEVNPLSDIIPGFAGTIKAPNLIQSAVQLQQSLQAERAVKLQQAQAQEAARLTTTMARPATTPQIQGPAVPQAQVPVAQVVQPAVTTNQIQAANQNIQSNKTQNINQGGSKGISLSGQRGKTVQL